MAEQIFRSVSAYLRGSVMYSVISLNFLLVSSASWFNTSSAMEVINSYWERVESRIGFEFCVKILGSNTSEMTTDGDLSRIETELLNEVSSCLSLSGVNIWSRNDSLKYRNPRRNFRFSTLTLHENIPVEKMSKWHPWYSVSRCNSESISTWDTFLSPRFTSVWRRGKTQVSVGGPKFIKCLKTHAVWFYQ